MAEHNILLTAEPRTGKTTLLKKVLAELNQPSHGFWTEEVAPGGTRIGFDMITHNNERFALASTKIETPYRVGGKYFVQVDNLEQMLKKMTPVPPNRLLYLDEIGQMELLSPEFIRLANLFLDAPQPLLGTMCTNFGHPFIDIIKNRPDVKIVEVTLENRDQLVHQLSRELSH